MTPSARYEISFQRELAAGGQRFGREEEAALSRRWQQQGDRRAAEALARAHLRTVNAMAVSYRHYGVAVSELIAEGNCGLVHALGKFDPERGIRFVTYATHWIRAHMLACVVRSKNLVGGSSGPMRSQLFFKLRRERARVTTMLGEQESASVALAERMGLSVERVKGLLERLDAQDVSLDSSLSPDSTLTVLERLTKDNNPEQELARARRSYELEAAVATVLACLDGRERTIVEQRLMATTDEHSLAELARGMGISRERARQLELRARAKLKAALLALARPAISELLEDLTGAKVAVGSEATGAREPSGTRRKKRRGRARLVPA